MAHAAHTQIIVNTGRVRQKMWKGTDDADTSIRIKATLDEFFNEIIIRRNLQLLDDMLDHVEVDIIEAHADKLFMPLIKLDPRGSYFSQTDIEAATQIAAAEEKNAAAFAAWAKDIMKTPADLTAMIAFSIRILLKKVRAKQAFRFLLGFDGARGVLLTVCMHAL